MSNQPDITSQSAEQRLRKAYNSLISKKRNTVLFRTFLIALAWFTCLVLTEELLYLSGTAKTVLLASLLAAVSFSAWYGFKSIRNEDFKEFYREFARKSSLSELKDALDLEENSMGNRSLIDAAILQNLSRVNSNKLNSALDKHLSRSDTSVQYKKSLTLSGLAFLVALFSGFNFSGATGRVLSFWESFEKPNPFLFTVHPGNTTVEQGSPFSVEVEFDGAETPGEVSLLVKTEVEKKFRSRSMEKSGGTYTSIPFDLNSNLEYYVRMDEYATRIFRAEVQLRPRFTDLSATVVPPSYTNLESTRLSYPFSQIRAYQGSKLELSGILNKPIRQLVLTTTGDTLNPGLEDGRSFTADFDVTENDTLAFSIVDSSGLTNRNPFQLIISPLEDEYPLVELIEPETALEMVQPAELDILFRASDDFGLTSAQLGYELQRAYVDEPIAGSAELPDPENGVLKSFTWNLKEIQLKPRDVLSFWVEVRDNDGYSGSKTARSRVATLTVPSVVDYFENVDKKEKDVEKDLENISESFKQMQQQYDQFKEKMKENPDNPGYEQKKELEQVQKMQENIQKQVDELNKKFEEIKKELDQNSMLSEETMKTYEELKKMMKEIDDPEFLKSLEELQKQLGQLNPEQLRKAMEEAEFNEELYKERLERTLEYFKQIKLNSDLEKIARSLEELAEKEKELSESKPTREKFNQQRKQSLEETEKLQQQIDSLSNNTTKKTEKTVEKYQEEASSEMDKAREQMKEQIEQGEKEKSEPGENRESPENQGEKREGNQQQNQKNQNSQNQNSQQQNQNRSMERQFQNMAQMTRNTMEAMNQQQMQINMAGLQYALHSLLNLSLEQEDLVSLSSETESRSQAFITYAREQKNIEQIFTSISDSLYKLSTDIPQFSNMINKKKLEVEKQLSAAMEQMAERNQNQSSVASRQALGGINEISFMIANLLEQMQNSQNGGSGSGSMSMQQMMEKLQNSGQQQQQLNKQLQEMINDIQGERLSQDQMQRLNQIAKQQNMIRKQLEEIQKSGALEGGDKLGSELQRMIEEMEDTINDLRGGSTDPTMIKRQQNILSRMLEAEKSLQERDKEEKRKAQTADQVNNPTPPELTLEELEKQIRNRLNDPEFTKYSSDYQRLIERYFELLKEIQKREIQ